MKSFRLLSCIISSLNFFSKKQLLYFFITLSFLKVSILTSIGTPRNLLSLQELNSHLNALSNKMERKTNIDAIDTELDGYSFDDWYEKCIAKPYFKEQSTPQPKQYVSELELTKTIREFVKVNTANLTKPGSWISHAPSKLDYFFTSQKPVEPIQPFVQKLIINPGTKIAFHGDFHGDKLSIGKYIKALQQLGYMSGFNIRDPSKFYLVFLGDYVDRGIYGTEVLYTLMRLKIANPDNVIIIRGNHEDRMQNQTDGFTDEFILKYPFGLLDQITRIYDLLPVALYLGSGSNFINYLLCIHGGLTPKFNSRNLLTSPNRVAYDWLKFEPEDTPPTDYGSVGFMWNDFNVNPLESTQVTTRGKGIYSFSQIDTEKFLNDHSNFNSGYFLKGVFRAHQHGERNMVISIFKGNGVSKLWLTKSVKSRKLWDNIVATFLVAPDTPYGEKYNNYDYDAFALLTTDKEFKKWKLDIYNNENIYDSVLKTVNKSLKTKKELLKEARELLDKLEQTQKLLNEYESAKKDIEKKLEYPHYETVKPKIYSCIAGYNRLIQSAKKLSFSLNNKMQSKIDKAKLLN